MIRLAGDYFDGIGSRPSQAELVVDGGRVELHHQGTARVLPLQTLKVDSRLGSTPRRIEWGERASFVTSDQAGADKLDRMLPNSSRLHWVAWLERHMVAVAASVLVSVAITAAFAIWGVPALSRVVAAAVPQALSMKLGDSTLGSLDQMLAPSELPARRQAELRAYFTRHGVVEKLHFRKAGRLGANALTLSATHVLFTDELVNMTDVNEELLAVYLHELGHARMHHVERSILQNSAWAVMLTMLTGDFSGAAELVVVVPVMVGQMAYSRDLEREADGFAVAALRDAGLSAEHLAAALEKLERSHQMERPAGDDEDRSDAQLQDDATAKADTTVTESSPEMDEDRAWARRLFEYFSTHPATEERIRTIREHEADLARSQSKR